MHGFCSTAGVNARQDAAPLYWHSTGEVSIPPELEGFDLRPGKPEGAGVAICFVPLGAEHPVSTAVAVRQILGPDEYLIGVADAAFGAPRADDILQAGFDDVLLLGRLDDMTLCLARARTVLARRRRMRRDLAQVKVERDYLQACIDSLPTPIFFKNGEGTYVGCNKAFEGFIGLPTEKVIGSSVYDVAPEDLARRYQQADDALLARGGEQVYECEVRYADGSLHHVAFHKAAIVSEDGRLRGIAGAMLDITDRKSLEVRLIDAAARDPLTNAYNRRKFFEIATEAIELARREGRPVSVAVIDLDRFKSINDQFGHAEGDRVLCATAALLEGCAGDGITIARAGGEEFYALFPGFTLMQAAEIADSMRRQVSDAGFLPDVDEPAGTLSIGVAELDPLRGTLWDALKEADEALYRAKRSGRNRICIALRQSGYASEA
ncbi:diguanylate cyclase [Ciceribacter sp. RN22]|uniref:sensor domain-containing diguanylate cyclase n=1 Tax=Ciceribacter sp. RN22 TaxID=2954932 RepID=UPI002092F662|nr:diguanylate cyclase [Ciceribacter sp. RN22]MCO6177710.1 diguanylate cyclase [Ciceribacter sp. RN22]